MTQAKECKKCHALSPMHSHFCEACGKKFGGSNSDSGMIVVIILVLVIGAVVAYSQGYRMSDAKKLLIALTPNQTAQQAAVPVQ